MSRHRSLLGAACAVLLTGLGAQCPAPVTLPALAGSQPAEGTVNVFPGSWIRLDFAAPIPKLVAFQLACDGAPVQVWATRLGSSSVVLNPSPELPAPAACELSWPTSGGTQLSFSTIPAAPFEMVYDPTAPRATTPIPDDFWLVDDASTATGKRVQIPLPAFTTPGAIDLATGLLAVPNTLDGFSPVAPIVLRFPFTVSSDSLPADAAASLDPLATIGLFDLTPGSPTRGRRIPFVLGPLKRILVPAIPLQPEGRYGLVVTRTLRAGTRVAGPSAFFAAALADPLPGEDPAVAKVRGLVNEVLAEIGTWGDVAYLPEDVALVLSISVRSLADLPADLVAMRSQIQAASPPAFQIDSVSASGVPGVAALVEGTWEAPDFRMSAPNILLNRDADGLPLQNGTRSIGFTLALPDAAGSGPVPIVMHQHGSPGCAEEEVPRVAGLRGETDTLAESGFAVAGFTDPVNREILNPSGPPCALDLDDSLALQFQVYAFSLMAFLEPPDYQVQTNAEQIAFVRLLQSLGALDCLPLNAECDGGDGVPELDVTAPLAYLGVSMGSNHAPGFLPYAPEIAASVLTVGGGRFIDWVYFQNPVDLIFSVRNSFPEFTEWEVLWGLSLFQQGFDDQETALHAARLYREPVDLGGSGRRSSVLLAEGIGDTIQPNHATRSLAWALGPIPHLAPRHRETLVLEPASSPVQGNIDADTTAAFQQWVPSFTPGIPPTPGCEALPQGHYCAQSAWPAVEQWIRFFQSALTEPAPIIEDPLLP